VIVAVTGASGHVGAALVRALLERGHRVRAAVRSDTRAIEGLELDRVKVDVTNERDVRALVDGAEVVFHAAARVTLEVERDAMADEVNVRGTRNVVRASKDAGVKRLVHFSTAHALARGSADLLASGSGLPYERSKAEAERDVIDASRTGLDAVIVSPCAVVGPFDHKPSYIGRTLLLLARGLVPAAVHGGQSWVDVRDIATGAISAAERGVSGDRYILGGHWMPMFDFLRAASKVAGVRAPMFRVPSGIATRLAPYAERASRMIGQEPLLTRASLEALELEPRPRDERAIEILSHAPRPVEETLRDTYAWFQARGLMSRRRFG